MKKTIIKGSVFVIVFVVSLFVIGRIMNKGNNDMTMEMEPASLPLIYTQGMSGEYNCLHGYTSEVDVAFQRENITVLSENRGIGFRIDTFGEKVEEVAFEVRDLDGDRLIEDGIVHDVNNAEDDIYFSVSVKDLIEEDTEYNMILRLTMENGKEAKYFTRFVWGDSYFLDEKLSFVQEFHRKTFDKESARDITKYLESNASGDNTNYGRVNIHSSFDQITWGDLEVYKETAPQYKVMELENQTANIQADYIVRMKEEEERQYYRVRESYRIRYTADRIYLLDFERTMNRFFEEEKDIYVNNKIVLGIIGDEIPIVESEDGNVFAFVVENKLCSYNVATNKLAVLFSFYNAENQDARTLYDNHEIKILSIDEAGNVRFLVAGYMNRGKYEGKVGLEICYYNSTINTIEEEAFIPTTKSAQIMRKEMERLSYVNMDDIGYFAFQERVYKVDLTTLTQEIVAEDIQDGGIQVSNSQKMLVWQGAKEENRSKRIILMDLNSGTTIEIEAQDGEYIKPLGFMGEDLIYGVMKQDDITMDAMGYDIYPMYAVYIQNSEGKILKSYKNEGIYVTGCDVNQNQITLNRAKLNDAGEYEAIGDDHIMNNEIISENENMISQVATENYKKITQIALKDNVDKKVLKILTPKLVMYEGSRSVDIELPKEESHQYYVYANGEISLITADPAVAVNLANEEAGVVINENGNYIWKRGNRSVRNQIMAIKEPGRQEEKSSMAVCLDTILNYENVSRNSQFLLEEGSSFYEILEDSLTHATVLNLRGCTLDSVLYYVNRDIPVLAVLSDGSAVLVIGFNEYNIVVMDPKTGTISKRGMHDSTEWLEENGNSFVTYVPEGM